MQKHSSSEVKWLGSRKGPSVDDLQTIGCSSGLGVDRKLRAKHRTPPQQKHPWHGSASVIDLKFSTRSWRVSNHHRNRDGCLAGLSGFWFWNTFSVSGASAPALLLSRLYKKKKNKKKPAIARRSRSLIILVFFFLPRLSKAIITALRCESVLAMADKGSEIVSNDGSTSAATSQSCLFQQ